MLVILILLAIPLAISLLTYTFFWYETASSPHRQYLANLTKGKAGRLLIRGIVSSYCSMLLTVILFPTSFRQRQRQPASEPDCLQPPVILVHGLYHNVSAWTLYRRWLHFAGFANVYCLGYSSWNQTFPALVNRLQQLLIQVHEKFPDQRPILIGHSLGGLVGRACAHSAEGSAHLAGVITLGTPHRGSKLAAFGVGKLARSLLYGSPLIETLERASGAPDCPCVAIYSPIDNMVLPSQALKTTEAGWVHHETAPISHVTMLYHRPTAMLVIEYLKSMASPDH